MFDLIRPNIVGKRLKQVRDEHKLTQRMFADLIDASAKKITYYEWGDFLPETQTLINVHRVFGVNLDWILGEPDAPKYELSATFVMIAYQWLEAPLKARAEEVGISLTDQQIRSTVAFLLETLPVDFTPDIPNLEEQLSKDPQLIDSALIVHGDRNPS